MRAHSGLGRGRDERERDAESDAADRAAKLSERAYLAFNAIPLSVGARQQHVRISVGVAVYPKDCETADELLGNAHLALGRARASRRCSV